MAAPVIRGVGTPGMGTAKVAPGLPTGTIADDLLLMFVETAGQAIAANGWTPLDAQLHSGSGAGITVLYRVATGADPTDTTDSGDHQMARIVGIQAGTWDTTNPFGAVAKEFDGNNTTNKQVPGGSTDVDEALVFAAIAAALPDATGSANFSGWGTGHPLTFTEQIDNTTAAGNGGGLGVATAVQPTAGAYAAIGVQLAVSSVAVEMSFSVNPPATASAVGRSLEAIWNLRSRVTRSIQKIWNMRASQGKTLEARWRVLSRTARLLAAIWHVRVTVSSEIELPFAIRESVSRNMDSLWNLRSTAARELDFYWDALERVHADLEALWETRETASGSTDLRWDVLTSITHDLELVWNDLNSAARTLGLSWNTNDTAGAGLDLRWDVLSSELATAIGRALGIEWKTLNAAGKSIDARWDLSESVRRDIEVLWNTAALLTAGAAIELMWNTRQLTAAEMSARWHVLVQLAESLEVAVGNVQLAWAAGSPVSETSAGAGPQSWQTERPRTRWEVGPPTT